MGRVGEPSRFAQVQRGKARRFAYQAAQSRFIQAAESLKSGFCGRKEFERFFVLSGFRFYSAHIHRERQVCLWWIRKDLAGGIGHRQHASAPPALVHKNANQANGEINSSKKTILLG